MIDLLLHVDTHLQALIAQYGIFVYVILFLIVFCETGLVVTPFLPGDSLLFAAGTFAAVGSLNVWLLFAIFLLAAVVGDAVNYAVGRNVGSRIFKEHRRFLNTRHVEEAQRFYERYGSKAIVLARFVPIIRTFAPFVAGIGKMEYATFAFYNIAGGLLWVAVGLFSGLFFGNIPFVKEHFSEVIILIVVVSLLPMVWHIVRRKND